jgi:uncharacterized protein YcfJ
MKLTALVAALFVASTAAHAEVRFSKDQRQPESRAADGAGGQVYTPSPLFDVPNQLIRYAPVVNIETMSKLETGVTQRQLCGVTTVPIQRNVPIVEPTYNQSGALIGTVIGAAIGHRVSGGNSGATIVGGVVGAGVGGNSGQRIVGHTTQTIGYQQQNTCQIIEEPYSRNVIVGYLVTYDDNGVRKTISTTVHPGPYVRLVTTTRTEM